MIECKVWNKTDTFFKPYSVLVLFICANYEMDPNEFVLNRFLSVLRSVTSICILIGYICTCTRHILKVRRCHGASDIKAAIGQRRTVTFCHQSTLPSVATHICI